MDASLAYASQGTSGTTRNLQRKNSQMFGLAQRAGGSKSVAMRLKNSSNLLGKDDFVSKILNTVTGRTSLNKSISVNSIGGSEEKLHRSQINIDRKMREDFDRLQKQLNKRKERETQA